MKKLWFGLIAVVSLTNAVAAADLAVKAPPMLAAPFSWTGVYLGVHGGYGWTTTDGLKANGGFGPGGQIGYNFQTGNFVFGIEADIAASDISQTIDDVDDFGNPFTATFRNNALASLRGRAGIAYDTWLFYGTAGGGWGHNKLSVDIGSLTLSSAAWQSGWSAGTGVEWAFAPNWSAKLEYVHYGLGSADFFGFLPSGHIDIDTVKIGVNYHFR
jgi:outer membrane immunogenic protein